MRVLLDHHMKKQGILLGCVSFQLKPCGMLRVACFVNLQNGTRNTLHGFFSTHLKRTQIILRGVPAEAWAYRLGTYSALEWILERYKEKKPKDPTIAEKFNTYKFGEYKKSVIELLGRVCTVSVETMKIERDTASLRAESKKATLCKSPFCNHSSPF